VTIQPRVESAIQEQFKGNPGQEAEESALRLAFNARIFIIVHSDTTKLKIESANATIANEPCVVSIMDVT
jgi:hypothetical protein